jgi:hypothetical protein
MQSVRKSLRYNPFTNSINQKLLTEYHTIRYIEEANIFGVKLREAPLINTSIQIQQVDNGYTFSEVAFNTVPQQGEFRVDYYNPSDDPLYKGTGYIEFNSADQNKVVKINYYGAGEYGDFSELPVGTIILIYSNNAPNGFISLNGGVLGKTDFYELWQFAQNNNLVSTVLGQTGLFIDLEAINPTTYPNKFRLPDFRGTFLRIAGINSVYTQYNGNSIGSFDFDKFRSHNHTYFDRWWGLACCAAGWPGGPSHPAYLTGGTYSTGTTGDNETAPFRISLNIAIKYES